MRNPFLIPAVGFAVGVTLARIADLSIWDSLAAVAVFGVATAFSRGRRWYAGGLFCALGAAEYVWRLPAGTPELDAGVREVVALEGCVVEPPAFFEDKQQYVLELAPGARARVQAYPREGEPPLRLRYGQRVEVEARVRKPRNFGNPGAFDYVEWLRRRQIYWLATARTGSQPRILGECGSPVLTWIYGLRTAALEQVERLYGTDPSLAGLLQALLVGEGSRLERDWADDYRRTGTYHAIVVSGLHVTVIGAALTGILRLLAPRGMAAGLAASLLVWVYAGMCGWQTPVARAAGGFTLFAIGRLLFRRVRLLNLLSVLALGFLAYDPEQLFDASFQLTFLAVAALGGLAEPAAGNGAAALARGVWGLGDPARDLRMPPRVAQFRVELRLAAETLQLWLGAPARVTERLVQGPAWGACKAVEMVGLSAAVQLGLALPMVLYFHRLSLSGLTANLAVTPALTGAVPLGFVSLFSGWEWTRQLTTLLVRFSRAAAEWHSSWEPNWRTPDPPWWLAAIFAAALAALAIRRSRWALAGALGALACILAHPFPAARQAGALEMTVTDVGQGDSVLIGFPDGKWMVVDGGGIPGFGGQTRRAGMDIGEDVVTPYLLSRSIQRVDVLVNTHQHEDHMGGLPALMENFRPAELWVGAAPRSEAFQRLHAAAARMGTRIRAMRHGPEFAFGGAQVRVVAPTDDYEPREAPSNNDSLVLRIAYGRHAFLLTGDMERQMEYAIAEKVGHADVLKVGHHGSRTSTTDALLDATRPAMAIISAGKDNLFNHPHPAVLERLAQRHITTLRTDLWGQVTVRTDGARLSMDTYRWRGR